MTEKGVANSTAPRRGGPYEQKTFKLDSKKFKELIVYIVRRSTPDPTFGAIKLNKVLYYSDFAAYRQLGQPITGATYRKYFEGPAPMELPDVRRELINSGDATSEERPYFVGSVVRLVIRPGREPNRELFRPGELEIVDQVVDFFEGKTEREVADFSHKEPGWAVARDREDIPYETAWMSSGPISQEVEEVAIRFAEGHYGLDKPPVNRL